MNWDNIWQVILTIVGAIGGGGVVIIGLSSWLGNMWANRLTERFRYESEERLRFLEATQAERLKKLEAEQATALSQLEKRLTYEYESRLETEKQRMQVEQAQNLRFLEKQFDLYISLWDKLQELRFAGDNLWQEANPENLSCFAEAYQQVRLLADKASIVMSADVYQQLQHLLRRFEDFRVGKRNLVELRTKNSVILAYNESVRGGDDEYFRRGVQEQVRMNGNYRDQYEYILERIRQELQERLATTPYRGNADHMLRR